MRKIIVLENVTVAGYFAGLNGELDWAVQDEGPCLENLLSRHHGC